VAPSGRLVARLATYCGTSGRQAGGGFGWWLKRRIEREGEKNGRNPRAKG